MRRVSPLERMRGPTLGEIGLGDVDCTQWDPLTSAVAMDSTNWTSTSAKITTAGAEIKRFEDGSRILSARIP